MTDDPGDAAGEWSALSPQELENFLDAIARHRRASWRVTLASTIAIALAAFVVATLAAPLFYAVLGLAFDVANLITPTPNLIGNFMAFVDKAQSAPGPVPVSRWFEWALITALPGMVVMALVIIGLHRAVRTVATFDAAELSARTPDPTVLAEQRFANVINEMSIAANLPAPRVFVTDMSVLNAAVFGYDESHATVVVSKGMLARLNRAEMQGVAAHLVSSIADGDMKIGLRVAVTMSFFNVTARLASILNDPGAARKIGRMVRPMLLPTKAGAHRLAEELAEPFASDKDEPAAPKTDKPTVLDRVREGLRLVLAGPVVMTGFFGGIVSMSILGPLLAFAWRQRKYMADATAVRLTRDPDTLGRALEKIAAAGGGGTLASWATHLSIASARGSGFSLFGGSIVPMFPSPERRLRALQKLGATLTPPKKQTIPLKMMAIGIPLFTVLIGAVAMLLPLLVYVSLLLSMIFVGLPVGILHLLLRSIGHS